MEGKKMERSVSPEVERFLGVCITCWVSQVYVGWKHIFGFGAAQPLESSSPGVVVFWWRKKSLL
ncbi:MAG: hypothetical protein DRO11_05955 [Methanobacteriota archaeon]|nr:MAG: hypothetical protein DRO11_05955 [Euryarchaeota archaeon]